MPQAGGVNNLPLGPQGFSRIAVVGSAPSSLTLAPFDDARYAVWAVSPGAYGYCRRMDAFFELHRWEPCIAGKPGDPNGKGWFSPEYVRFLEQFPGPVFMSADGTGKLPLSVANACAYPYPEMLAKYGRYFFTSSMAWMLALAIEQLAPRAAAGEDVAIGMWGVDMAANTEYAFQRPGCQHFLGLAASLGIRIEVPLESDLLQPPTLYGISEYHPRHARLLARKNELERRRDECNRQISMLGAEVNQLTGAIDSMNYMFEQWVDDVEDPNIADAVSRSATLLGRPAPQEAANTALPQALIPGSSMAAEVEYG